MPASDVPIAVSLVLRERMPSDGLRESVHLFDTIGRIATIHLAEPTKIHAALEFIKASGNAVVNISGIHIQRFGGIGSDWLAYACVFEAIDGWEWKDRRQPYECSRCRAQIQPRSPDATRVLRETPDRLAFTLGDAIVIHRRVRAILNRLAGADLAYRDVIDVAGAYGTYFEVSTKTSTQILDPVYSFDLNEQCLDCGVCSRAFLETGILAAGIDLSSTPSIVMHRDDTAIRSWPPMLIAKHELVEAVDGAIDWGLRAIANPGESVTAKIRTCIDMIRSIIS